MISLKTDEVISVPALFFTTGVTVMVPAVPPVSVVEETAKVIVLSRGFVKLPPLRTNAASLPSEL